MILMGKKPEYLWGGGGGAVQRVPLYSTGRRFGSCAGSTAFLLRLVIALLPFVLI
jgi:hypothetical protein